MIIFLDESGDLGFDFNKPGTSKTFVITLLVCDDRESSHSFKIAVRRTFKNKMHSRKNPGVREIKGTETMLSVKRYFHRQLPRDGWKLYTVVVNKKQVYEEMPKPMDKKKLYNFLSRFILEKIPFGSVLEAVTLVVDRSKGKEGIREFNDYITNHLEGLLPLNVPMYITHEWSHENAGLQAVDLFCWGIFRKWESGDNEWYEVFQNSIAVCTEYPE